jgi:hypothetical protein
LFPRRYDPEWYPVLLYSGTRIIHLYRQQVTVFWRTGQNSLMLTRNPPPDNEDGGNPPLGNDDGGNPPPSNEDGGDPPLGNEDGGNPPKDGENPTLGNEDGGNPPPGNED